MKDISIKNTNGVKIGKRKLLWFIRRLKEGDNYDKEKAIELLTSSPDKKIVEHVIPLLKEKDTQVRMAAWEILKRVGSSDLDAVVALLDEESEDIRIYACEILTSLKNESTIPSLIRKVYEENPNVRNMACIALGGFNDERVVDALLDALNDDEWTMFSAIESLGKINNKRAIQPLLNVLKNGDEEVSLASCEALTGFHDETVLNEMLDVLKSLNQEKRDLYLKVILEKGDEHTFQAVKERIGDELLIHLLNCIDQEGKKSLNLLKMLVNFKRPEACEAVLKALKQMSSDEKEYEESIQILVILKDIWEKHVIEYMQKDNGYILPLIRGCKLAGFKIDEKPLTKVFLSSPIDIKRELLNDIPVIVNGSSLLIIKEAMKDSDSHVKGNAMTAAGMMSLAELKEAVAEAAQKDFLDVRIKALKALISLDLNKAMDLINKFVNDGSSDDKKTYLAVAQHLNGKNNLLFIKKLLLDEDERIRGAAIDVIGNFLDNEEYLNFFLGQLMGENIPHEVLKIIKEKRLFFFKDRLREIFDDMGKDLWTRYYALSALAVFEDHSLFDTFTKGLEDESSIIKIGCLKALADINDSKALDYIMPFVGNDDEDIRSAAEFVISRFKTC